MAGARRMVRRAFGWARLMEARNKLVLARTAPALHRFETSEVQRLRPTLPRPARALVATIIPTYRRPELLRRAVASALAQTVTDQVVVVVDDGGGLPDLPSDPRLIAVSLSRNLGVAGVVRNVGIRLTDSRFVAFLDDDNTWTPDHLATALETLGRPRDASGVARTGPAPALVTGRARRAARIDGVYTALSRRDCDGRLRDVLSVPFDRRRAADACFLDTNAFVARRTAGLRFSRLRRTPDVMPREDWELIFRYSRRHRVRHIPVPTVDYLVNQDSYWTAWDSA